MPEPVIHAADSSIGDPKPLSHPQPLTDEYVDSGLPDNAVVRQAAVDTQQDHHEDPYILLITDDRVFGELVTHALDRLHYRTAMLYTADPAVAISRCAAERPDLAMLNVDSLSLGGISLSRRLKADTPNLKVLSLVHGHELEAAQREAEVSGSDAVCGLLEVPLQLGAIVRELLERSIEEREAAVPEPVMTLQDRIRSEASVFDFSALLDGVRTENELAPDSTTVAVTPEPQPMVAAEPSPRAEVSRDRAIVRKHPRRPAKPALVAMLGIAAVALPVYLLNNGVLQSDNEVGAGQTLPSKPDINLTVRKGLPFPPITPGERLATPRLEGPITADVKLQVFNAYGLGPMDAQSYVIIRLIPVELGGTENVPNLFPTTPWFQDLKSRLDSRLVELVKGGRLTIQQAESELKDNWVRASHRYYIRNYGIDDPDKAREKEDQLKW